MHVKTTSHFAKSMNVILMYAYISRRDHKKLMMRSKKITDIFAFELNINCQSMKTGV